MKVKCPRKGCNYYATAEAADDAMVDLQDHLREVHGIEEVPDRIKRAWKAPSNPSRDPAYEPAAIRPCAPSWRPEDDIEGAGMLSDHQRAG